MKLLIGSPNPIDLRLGAAQIAWNLASSCRHLGHQVEFWEPATAASRFQSRLGLRRSRAAFRKFVRERPDIDVVESASWMMGDHLRGEGRRLVVRGVQPDMEYLRTEAHTLDARGWRSIPDRLQIRDTERLIETGWIAADRIVVLTEQERHAMSQSRPALAGKLRSYVVAPSADERAAFRRVASKRSARRKSIGEARLIWIGRWAAHKGTAELLAFARSHLAVSPAARLTIAGAGSHPWVEVGALGSIGTQIEVIERFERSDLPALLARHDAGVFTSRIEGWGLSLQEMLESGLPVYASAAGAAPELEKWFPNQLRPFPPPPAEDLPESDSGESFAAYAEHFEWRRIAGDYLRSVMDP